MRAPTLLLPLLIVGCAAAPLQTFDASPIAAAPTQIDAASVEDEDPAVVRTRDGQFRAVWWSKHDGQVDLYTAVSRDGETWSAPQAITRDAVEDYYPAITQSRDGTLHLAWFRLDRRTLRKDVWYAHSADGRTWSVPTRVTTAGMDWAPAIYEDGFGMVWIVWSSERSGNRELYTARSGDGGRTWSKPFRLTQTPEEDDFPTVVARPNGERVLAWTRYRPGSKLDDYYRDASAEVVTATSKDGIAWSAPVVQSPPDPEAHYIDFLPFLVVDPDGSRVLLAWTSSRSGIKGDVLVRDLSSDASPIRQLTTAPGSDYGAKLVPGGPRGAYLMVWTSGREGAMHVFSRLLAM